MEALGLVGVLFVFWWPLAWLFCAANAMDAAGSKGQSRLGWLVLGLLFGPLALLALAAYSPAGKPPKAGKPGLVAMHEAPLKVAGE